MYLGAHISTSSGGILLSFQKAIALGLTSVQIFPGSPQRLLLKKVGEEEAAAVRALAAMYPLFLHAAYVVNPAIQDPLKRAAVRSYYLQCDAFAYSLGAVGFISHSGSYGEGFVRADGMRRVRSMLQELQPLLKTRIILENVAGLGTSLGRLPEDMLEMAGGFQKVGIAWDTAHAYAQGVDVSSPVEIRRCVTLLKPKLSCIHLNGVSVRVGLGTHLDRHELMVNCPVLGSEGCLKEWVVAGVPLIIEATEGRDALEDVRWLKTKVQV